MIKPTLQALFFVAIAGVLSCSNQTEETNNKQGMDQTQSIAKDISVQEFSQLVTDEVIVLDVRRSVEFQAGHLKSAVNIDYFSPNFVDLVERLDKSKPLLIYCASGGRSSGAMKKLSNSGFVVMYNMLGGFGAWKSAGLDYEK